MKIKSYKASDERLSLTGMIISDKVLGSIASNLGDERRPFRSKWSNIIAGWCLDHYEKYKEAPRGHIKNRLQRFAEEAADDAPVEIIEEMIQTLSDDMEKQSEELNDQFTLDTACLLFNSVKFEKLVEQLDDAITDKDLAGAEQIYSDFRPLEFSTGSEVTFLDKELAKEILSKEQDQTLIAWPNGLGEFFEDQFCRNSFISFAAPEKRGKSFWLQEVVWRAAKDRRRVLYYVTGDMSQDQTLKRLWRRATRLPYRAGEISIPTGLRMEGDEGEKTVRRSGRNESKGEMTYPRVEEIIDKIQKKIGVEDKFKLRVTPASSTSATDIENQIKDYIKEGWIPDVLVIDYADILKPEPHSRGFDFRHQVNETWLALRRISQQYHVCLVTATQTAATSYDADTIRKTDFSEDKRKIGHVTGMLGINQTNQEKERGIYRLNWVVLREGAWAEHQVVHTAGNLAIGCPAIVSEVFR